MNQYDRMISEEPLDLRKAAHLKVLSDAGVSIETWRDPLVFDDLAILYGRPEGDYRKILKLDQTWSLREPLVCTPEDLIMLFNYLGERRFRYEEPPTISLNIAKQTIAYLKETN